MDFPPAMSKCFLPRAHHETSLPMTGSLCFSLKPIGKKTKRASICEMSRGVRYALVAPSVSAGENIWNIR